MSSDSILILGNNDKKLQGFLSKLGYSLIDGGNGNALPVLLSKTLVDVAIIDTCMGAPDSLALCEFLRSYEHTREVPIVVLCRDSSLQGEIKSAGLGSIDCVPAPCSVGSVTSKVATNLRLRKLAGEESPHASLAEMNAALRDVNGRLLHEREQARAIQQSLLPKTLPTHERYELAVHYQPLDEVGGDWYFVQQEKGGPISIQIADVTGHGLSAAFIGSMTKLAISAAAGGMPDVLLSRINALVSPVMPEGRFITMEAVWFDPETGALKVSRAGHPPAIVVNRKKGTLTELRPDGFAVGFFEEGEYPLEQGVLEPGDCVMLITDGLSEQQNRSLESYGTARPGQALLKCPSSLSAAQLCAEVMKDFEIYCDNRVLKDDVTVLILKRST